MCDYQRGCDGECHALVRTPKGCLVTECCSTFIPPERASDALGAPPHDRVPEDHIRVADEWGVDIE